MLLDFELNILKKLEQHFYNVVPLDLATYCVLNSRIACEVLNHFHMEAILRTCQVRHYSTKGVYAIGFVKNELAADKWNGHAICKTKNWFVDASLFTFNKIFKLKTPLIVGATQGDFSEGQFSQYELNDGSVLKWFEIPEKIDEKIPEEPLEIIQKYAEKIIEIIEIN